MAEWSKALRIPYAHTTHSERARLGDARFESQNLQTLLQFFNIAIESQKRKKLGKSVPKNAIGFSFAECIGKEIIRVISKRKKIARSRDYTANSLFRRAIFFGVEMTNNFFPYTLRK